MISSPSSYDTQTLSFAVSLWCWSVTFVVVVQLVPENRNPLEVAKLAAQATDSSDDEGWRSTRLNDGGLLQEEDLNESRMMKGLSKGNNLVELEVEYGQTRMRKG